MKKWAYLIIFGVVITLGVAIYKSFLVITHPIKFSEEICKTSAEFNLDAKVVASIINIESSYKPNAKSNKNAIGLMQIKLSTAQYLNEYYNIDQNLSEQDLFQEKNNIKYGCMYLRYLLNRFEDLPTALSAYNAGETRVRAWLKDEQYSADGKTLTKIPYKETENYIKKFYDSVKFYAKVYN